MLNECECVDVCLPANQFSSKTDVMAPVNRRRISTPSWRQPLVVDQEHSNESLTSTTADSIGPSSQSVKPLDDTSVASQRPSRLSIIIPINRILQWLQRKFSWNRLPKKANIAPEETNDVIATDTAEIKSYLLAEKARVEAIKALMTSKDYNAALSKLMSDTNEDLHYFNRIKGEAQGERHLESFSRKHGNLLDFEERPPPVEQLNTCIWSGEDDKGNQLRCQNTCLYHPGDNLGVEQPKSLNHCVFHVKYCINADKHAIPTKIRIANNLGLCNECFILRNSCPPKALDEIPGIVRQ
jgi:hypothetical protein